MNHSTKREKPAKPYRDFPLFPHATKRWAKKIRGKLHYFGPWDDPQGALQRYLDRRDDLHAGRAPRPKRDILTLAALCNLFLDAKLREEQRGELTHIRWVSLRSTCKWMLEVLGRNRPADDLRPEDFALLRRSMDHLASNTQRQTIQQVRSLFNFAVRERLIAESPAHGHEFRPPGERVLRRQRRENGCMMFQPGDIRRMIEAASLQLRAMILLGINCGFGQGDCSQLTFDALDLEGGWVTFPRPKTSVDRRAALWPETVKAIREAIAERPEPQRPEYSRLVFLTRGGYPWVRVVGDARSDCAAAAIGRLLEKLSLKRRGVRFYTLRRTFETVSEESLDFPAVVHVMGHVDRSMTGAYRQKISDNRLRAVAEHVRKWLFAEGDKG